MRNFLVQVENVSTEMDNQHQWLATQERRQQYLSMIPGETIREDVHAGLNQFIQAQASRDPASWEAILQAIIQKGAANDGNQVCDDKENDEEDPNAPDGQE